MHFFFAMLNLNESFGDLRVDLKQEEEKSCKGAIFYYLHTDNNFIECIWNILLCAFESLSSQFIQVPNSHERSYDFHDSNHQKYYLSHWIFHHKQFDISGTPTTR
jgi:hypothetical protein